MTGSRKTKKEAPRYEEWEHQLFQTLSPVDPDPVFINRLRQRLQTPQEVALEKALNRRALAAGLLVAAAFLVILFALLLRDADEN